MKQNRDEIREIVFKRDQNKCIIPWCNHTPNDAHHLIDRKHWSNEENGGYILDNLVSLCNTHHILAENGTISPISLREWAKIKTVLLPKSFDSTKQYDKWGNELKENKKLKYPHTPYLSFSPNVDEKDIRESGYISTRSLLNKPLYFSIKMDGSNVVLTKDYVAARNGYDAVHASFDMLKQNYAEIKNYIPDDLMLFCEWLYAKHSIHYTGTLKLHNYLQCFGIYNRKTCMWLSVPDKNRLVNELMECTSNKPLIAGTPYLQWYNYSDFLLKSKIFTSEKDLVSEIIRIGNNAISNGHEGIVIRNLYAFHSDNWKDNIAKYVRKDHVQTNEHWSHLPIVRNEVE